MTNTTCIECGALSDTARCTQHKITKTKTNTDHAAYRNLGKWKRFSKRLRKLSPFCEHCGTGKDLTVDHIVRVTDRPEWTYEPDNCRVLCRRCNGLIANQPATAETENIIAAKIKHRRGGAPRRDASVRPQAEASLRSQSGMIQEKGDLAWL